MQVAHRATLIGPDGEHVLFTVHLGGIAVDAEDQLFVTGDNAVMVFDADGRYLRQLELSKPGWCVHVEGQHVWVGMDGCIAQLAPDGEQQSLICDEDRLGRVTSIAAIEDSLFVADATNRAIRKYSRQGEWLADLGGDVNTRGFMIPNGLLDLTVDPTTETLVVAHPQKHRVERYDLDGTLVDKWGRFGMHSPGDFGGCCNPTNIATSPDGLIAVSEKAPPRVKLYESVGTYLDTLPDDVFDPNTKNVDLAFDSTGKLYATDPHRRAVEVFELVLPEERKP